MENQFKLHLEKWFIYLQSVRGVGHTMAALKGVENIPTAKLICLHDKHANQIPNDKGISFYKSIKGSKYPIVFDNGTIYNMLDEILVYIYQLEKKIKILEDKNGKPE